MSANDEDNTTEARAARADRIRARFAAMTPAQKEQAFHNLVDFLADAEADEVMSMSDEQIRADLEADGIDVDAMVKRIRARIDEAVAKARGER